jgi:hypothetical protein
MKYLLVIIIVALSGCATKHSNHDKSDCACYEIKINHKKA